MNVYTVIKRHCEISAVSTDNPRLMAITLPAAPFAIPETDRSETAPRSAPVRSEKDWRKFDRTLRHVERMVR